MGLFDRVKSMVSSKAWPGHAEWVPAARVSPAPEPTPPAFAADATYLRVWLTEARLSHSRRWFTDWHPVVHGAVARTAGNTSDEHVAVVGPADIPGFEGAADAAVTMESPLTPLLPFAGGTVAINAGLAAIEGDNTVRALIDVVGSFGNLVTTTALATATTIATQVVEGFETLLQLDGNVGTLAFDGTLATAGGGANHALTPGYLAVLDQWPLAPDQQLWVREGALIAWAGDGHPSKAVEGSHLLLRLESRTERDDWRSLTAISDPMFAARGAADGESRRAHYQRAIVAARTSPDLHEADRIRVATALRDERDADAGFGAVDGLPGDLGALAAAAPLTADDALVARPSLAALLA